MGIEASITDEMERKQLWYGYVQRMNGNRLRKQVMERIPLRKRRRGRPSMGDTESDK